MSLPNPVANRDVFIYKLSDNYGFAKGNNMALKLLAGVKVDYCWLLNNDTVIDKDSIGFLQAFMDNHKDYAACTPQIRYYSPNNKIWNCGGRLLFGLRKYYYEDKEDVEFNIDYFDITFVTGCALFFRPMLISESGQLFTEKFFFGEEDFDFSLRMKKNNNKMACCLQSVIYHKVSASTKNKPKLDRIFIHYLNRYINIRQHFSKRKFCVWKNLCNLYIVILLRKFGNNAKTIRLFLKRLNNECYIYDGVTKEMFNKKFLLDETICD